MKSEGSSVASLSEWLMNTSVMRCHLSRDWVSSGSQQGECKVLKAKERAGVAIAQG